MPSRGLRSLLALVAVIALAVAITRAVTIRQVDAARAEGRAKQSEWLRLHLLEIDAQNRQVQADLAEMQREAAELDAGNAEAIRKLDAIGKP